MASIEKFLGKPVKKAIDGEEFEIYPLQFSDLDVLVQLGAPEKTAGAIKELLRKSLRKSVPGITDEQMSSLTYDFCNKFMIEIFEASGLKFDRKKVEEALQGAATSLA